MADITTIPEKLSDQSYTDYLSVLNQKLIQLQAAYNQKLSEYAAGVARYNDWVSATPTDWNFIQGTINPDNAAIAAARDRYKIAIDGLKIIIASVKTASDLEKQQAEAANVQAQANAAVTQASASMTPEQLYLLQLEKIKGQNEAAAQAAKLATQKQMTADATAKKEADEKAAKRKKNMIIAIVVVAIVAVIGFTILKTKK